MFPKPLHDMSTEELAAEIERIRKDRRSYLSESKKRPSRITSTDDPMTKMAKDMGAEEREALMKLIRERKKANG